LTDSLLDAFQLDATAVETARDRTEMFGGDVFGQLLNLGSVTEDRLLEHLSETTGLSAADRGDYAHIDRAAFESLDEQVLRENTIIPFRKHRRSLAVFVVDPLDSQTVEALSESYGVTISQFVWPRIRYEEALHSLLDDPLAEWLQPFLTQTSFKIGFAGDSSASDALESDESVPQSTDGRIGSEESSSAIDLDALGVGWSRAQTLDFLSRCFDRDALLYTLLGFSAKWLEDRMVLVLGHERAQPYLIAGWPGLSEDLRDLQTLRRVKVDVPADAILFDEDQIGHSTAEMPEDVGLGQLFVELTLFPPDNLLIQTVRIGSRPSMAVIGEPRDGKLPAVEPLEEVARAVGTQLEEIVRLAKSRQLPPPDERIPELPEPEQAEDEPTEDEQAEDDERPAVPGLAEASSSEPSEEPDTPGATAFGIPFADEAGDARSHSQKRSAVEVSSPGVGEDSSVSIMAPVDIDNDGAGDAEEQSASGQGDVGATMSGGFSVAEFQRGLQRDGGGSTAKLDAVEEGSSVADESSFAEESSVAELSEASQESKSNKSQAPMAQILRPVSLKKGRKSAEKTAAEDAEAEKEDPDPAPAGDDQSDGPGDQDLYVDGADVTVAGYPSIEIESAVEEDEPFEPLDESSELSELGGSSSSFEEDLEEIAMKLDNAEPHASFAAAEQLASFGEPAMELLEARFPGRLLVDRYQYTDETMPPVNEHGPVLAALAAAGSLAVPVVRSFLGHTSVELRFYATYLFTSLPAEDALEELAPRLFDRDHQTREVAKKIVLSTDTGWLEDTLVPMLYEILESEQEDLRIEVAADLLGAMRDQNSVPLLIERLNRANGRVKDRINVALRTITYKDFVPSASEWKNWWADAAEQSRDDWMIAALNSNSVEIRNLVFREISQLPDLDLNYHPDQPAKLRGRAQEELRQWLQRN
jgi:hypothetical protein